MMQNTEIYDFSKICPNLKVTKDLILSRITDAQIFYFYHGAFKLNKACKATLRVDTHASALIFMGSNGKLVYLDFREGRGLDCFAYVQKAFGLTFAEALNKIAADFGIVNQDSVKSKKLVERALTEGALIDKDSKKETLIQYQPKKWDKSSLAYWEFYEIEQSELERESVFPVDRLFVNHQEIYNPNNFQRYAKLENYTPNLTEPQYTKDGVKIYSPEDPDMKWLSSIPIDVPFGLDNLNTESNLIVIGKSFKDMIVLKKHFDSVIATQNESRAALSNLMIQMLDSMFDKKIIIWDNDPVGVENCKRFNSLGFDYWNVPREYLIRYGIKDPADFVRYYGNVALENLFKAKNLL